MYMLYIMTSDTRLSRFQHAIDKLWSACGRGCGFYYCSCEGASICCIQMSKIRSTLHSLAVIPYYACDQWWPWQPPWINLCATLFVLCQQVLIVFICITNHATAGQWLWHSLLQTKWLLRLSAELGDNGKIHAYIQVCAVQITVTCSFHTLPWI